MSKKIVVHSVGRAWVRPEEARGVISLQTNEGSIELVLLEGVGDELALQAARISEQIDPDGSIFDEIDDENDWDDEDLHFEIVAEIEDIDDVEDDEFDILNDPAIAVPESSLRKASSAVSDGRQSERRAFKGLAIGAFVVLLAIFIGLAALRGA